MIWGRIHGQNFTETKNMVQLMRWQASWICQYHRPNRTAEDYGRWNLLKSAKHGFHHWSQPMSNTGQPMGNTGQPKSSTGQLRCMTTQQQLVIFCSAWEMQCLSKAWEHFLLNPEIWHFKFDENQNIANV